MDIISLVVVVGFIVLSSVCIVVVKNVLGVSFLAACGIGVPIGYVVGMIILWLLGATSRKR